MFVLHFQLKGGDESEEGEIGKLDWSIENLKSQFH